jgi:hypothetical protein
VETLISGVIFEARNTMSRGSLDSLLDELDDMGEDFAPSSSQGPSTTRSTRDYARAAPMATTADAWASRGNSSSYSAGGSSFSSGGSGGTNGGYGGSSGDARGSSYSSSSSGASRRPAARRGASSLDDLLDECDDVMGAGMPSGSSSYSYGGGNSTATTIQREVSSTESSSSFSSVVLEGGERSAPLSLLCLKCDFEVLAFPGSRWTASADYLFFRNFHPDRRKLGECLIGDAAATAYSCQCTWQTVGATKKALRAGRETPAAPEGGTAYNGDVRWCKSRR